MIVQSTIIIVVVCCFVVLRSKTKGFKQKYSNKRSTIMVFQGKTIISLWDIMVRSFGSNNCSIRRIQPWFDPLDPTIVRSGGSNHGSILFLTCPVVFVRDPTIISLNPFSSFFILFHPFSSLFFKKKKRAEKGRDRSDIMVFLRKTIISRRDIMRKGKVS